MDEITFEDKEELRNFLKKQMIHAAKNLEFEEAARLRDQLEQLDE